MKFDKKDAEYLIGKGKSPERASEELDIIRFGFPCLKIKSPATVGNGIFRLSDSAREDSEKIWKQYLSKGGQPVKFVPASGAASRMFKNLHAFLSSKSKVPDTDFMKEFFKGIRNFPFYYPLNSLCIREFGLSTESLMADKRYKDIVSALLSPEGMNYGNLPKALVDFHIVPGKSRTAMEEHFAEGAQYAAGKNGTVRLHFTVSPEYIPLIETKIEEVKRCMEKDYGVKYDVDLSVQKSSTDTIAATPGGEPFRDSDGNLVLRPGGHGALIENLNELSGDVIFIKNIDNVVGENHREISNRYKAILGGLLVGTRQRIYDFLKELEEGNPTDERLDEIFNFLHKSLNITGENPKMSRHEKIFYLISKLNRPIRVCGMVQNEGEPGGGPFLCYNSDNTISPQILESSQIDSKDKKSRQMLKEASHFNPVDIVCSIKDRKGRSYNLHEYVDSNTGFISEKSKDGKALKALELPGLWNGAMSDWNTIFVEVPVETFNPVKTVNDLLRPMHQ